MKDTLIRYKFDRLFFFSFSSLKMLLHSFLASIIVKIMIVHTVVPCMWCVISFWLFSSFSLHFWFSSVWLWCTQAQSPLPKRKSYSRFLYFPWTPSLTSTSSSSVLLKIWKFSLSLTYSSSALLNLSYLILHTFTFSPKITLREEGKKHFLSLKNILTLLSRMWIIKSV